MIFAVKKSRRDPKLLFLRFKFVCKHANNDYWSGFIKSINYPKLDVIGLVTTQSIFAILWNCLRFLASPEYREPAVLRQAFYFIIILRTLHGFSPISTFAAVFAAAAQDARWLTDQSEAEVLQSIFESEAEWFSFEWRFVFVKLTCTCFRGWLLIDGWFWLGEEVKGGKSRHESKNVVQI